MSITKTDLATADLIGEFNALTQVVGTNISAPAPVSISAHTVAKKSAKKSVVFDALSTANTLGTGNAYNVTFTESSVNEEITNDTINAAVKSLKDSVNTQTELFRGNIETLMNTITAEINTNTDKFKTDVNTVFTGIFNESDAQVDEYQRVVNAITTEINDGFTNINTYNVKQNEDAATAINAATLEVFNLVDTVRQGVNRAQEEIAKVDDFFTSETENTANLDVIKTYFDSFQQTDLDIIAAVNYLMNENKNTMVNEDFQYVCTSADGQFKVSYRDDLGWGEFANVSDISVIAQTAVPNTKVVMLNQTKDDVTFQIMSDGVHYKDQPIDCSVTNIGVTLTGTHPKRAFGTMDVSRLGAAYTPTNDAVNTTDTLGS